MTPRWLTRPRLAFWLAELALRLLPRSRGDWAEAMRAELHYLDQGHLAWAIGLVFTSLKERVNVMSTSLGPERAAKLNIRLSLLFAAIFLMCTYLLKGTRAYEAVGYALVVAWLLPYFWLAAIESRGRRCRKES